MHQPSVLQYNKKPFKQHKAEESTVTNYETIKGITPAQIIAVISAINK